MNDDWAGRLRILVDGALDAALPPETATPEALHRAMRYAVFPGGKRVRPLLALAGALATGRRRRRVTGATGCDSDDETLVRRAMPCAVAVELVHSYSLIHDDLPAMDDDDFRRGRPTVHRAFGEALAILAGDALLPLAFEVLSGEGACRLMGSEAASAAMRELAHAAGSLGMAGGQAMDVVGAQGVETTHPGTADGGRRRGSHRRGEGNGERSGRAGTSDGGGGGGGCPGGVELLADLKTGALIRASARCGAIAAGAGPQEIGALTRYAELFGRAFQVFDDLKDMADDGSRTFPRAMGATGARRYGERLVAEALEALSAFAPDEAAELSDLARALGAPVA
ncbi:MAG: polyprenyl synthetase family protein [Bacillota bacterium]